jgi:hypothetical protein
MKSQNMWFLKHEELYTLEKEISKVETLPRELLLAKQKGLRQTNCT